MRQYMLGLFMGLVLCGWVKNSHSPIDGRYAYYAFKDIENDLNILHARAKDVKLISVREAKSRPNWIAYSYIYEYTDESSVKHTRSGTSSHMVTEKR